MRYTRSLRKGDTIAIVSPSFGIIENYEKRLENAIENLKFLGYKIVLYYNIGVFYKLQSDIKKERANAFMKAYLDPKVNFIFCATGGERLIDMLPYLDYEEIKKAEPKGVLGYSDISNLLFALTLKCDIATFHGPLAIDFGSESLNKGTINALRVIKAEDRVFQESFDFYGKDNFDINKEPKGDYKETNKVKWKSLSGENAEFQGRILGGCLDTITNLVGTRFGDVQTFGEKYRKEGIILYFESCDMNSVSIYRALWQMKELGWFNYLKGVLIGRPVGYSDVLDFTLEDSLKEIFNDLNVPVIFHVDIGHTKPQLTIVNGAIAKVKLKDSKGEIETLLK